MLDWTSVIVAFLHQNKITQKQLAEEMGLTNEYICTILSGKKKSPADIEERMRSAIESIVARRREENGQ